MSCLVRELLLSFSGLVRSFLGVFPWVLWWVEVGSGTGSARTFLLLAMGGIFLISLFHLFCGLFNWELVVLSSVGFFPFRDVSPKSVTQKKLFPVGLILSLFPFWFLWLVVARLFRCWVFPRGSFFLYDVSLGGFALSGFGCFSYSPVRFSILIVHWFLWWIVPCGISSFLRGFFFR